jgi:predicted amidohydrolase YtcJ
MPDLLLIRNGNIYTGNDEHPWCEAVIVSGDTIIFTGAAREAERVISGRAEVIDLAGACMLPGFIDSHTHLAWGGSFLSGVDLSEVNTKDEFIRKLRSFIQSRTTAWITGGNWNEHNWVPAELPNRAWIDDFTKDVPVLISRMDYHIALANTKALELAGINEFTAIPAGGEIDKDAHGKLTGILRDTAIDLVNAVISAPTDAENRAFIQRAINSAISQGVTSVQDMADPDLLDIYKQMELAKTLQCRIFARLPMAHYQQVIRDGVKFGSGSSFVRYGSMKAFADGSLGAATAFFFEPYSDAPDNYGLEMEELRNGGLRNMMIASDKAGLQLSIHAIGDRAIDKLLTVFEEIDSFHPREDRRHRIEHAQHLRIQDIPRFAKAKVIASMQPSHLFEDGAWMESKIGKERLAGAYAFGSLVRAGAHVCFGSDFPVVPFSPLAGIFTAVTRKTKHSRESGGCVPSERIPVRDAIRCYTREAAFAAGEEHIKGTIETGKLADFVVLDKNIFTAEPDSIPETKVLMTIVGGTIVYDNR